MCDWHVTCGVRHVACILYTVCCILYAVYCCILYTVYFHVYTATAEARGEEEGPDFVNGGHCEVPRVQWYTGGFECQAGISIYTVYSIQYMTVRGPWLRFNVK